MIPSAVLPRPTMVFSAKTIVFTLPFIAAVVVASAAPGQGVRAAKTPPTGVRNAHYVSNRPPLVPSPFVKLPVGAITPKGWLRRMLELEANGLTGRLEELSPWCKADGNAWLSPTGQGHSPWEELPYWLKGFGDLGYVLHDDRIITEARKWIEGILSSQDADGYFGPRANRDRKAGPDVWPNMLALNCLQSFYEYTGDKRVLPFMTRYFRWQMNLPDDKLLLPPPFWQRMRAGDNLESIYWLYNRTGEAWLLDLAERIHRNTADWTGGIASWHGVNIAQCFREPAEYYQQAKDLKFLRATERDYEEVMEKYGQVPGGGYGADENCRPGYYGPRQATETCTWVELMHSFELLTRISGNSVWADRCEEVAFNSFPASQPPDQKGLHYLTAPNMVQLDRRNHAPLIQNRGCMLAYDPRSYRCCQHNVSHGWPYYAEELWLATADNGLCASLYAASEVAAKVGRGTQVTIREETDYPFRDQITFYVSCSSPARFPLYLRVPRWCADPEVEVNGARLEGATTAPGYLVVDRTWRDGDRLRLRLPMTLHVRTWKKNHDSVSIDRGPLTYSLKIGERWKRYGGTDDWPAYEVFPTTAWNYGLELDPRDAAAAIRVLEKPTPVPSQPFTPEAAPVELRVKARKIPEWTLENGLIGSLQASPARTSEPVETVALIPMGCARLRVSAFPTVTTGPEGHVWTTPPLPPLASHCNPGDTVRALNDGIIPKSSSDQSIPRMTWWDHRGTREWVAYQFDAPRTLASCEVYWFDDTGVGQCRVPASWRVLWEDGDAWRVVETQEEYGVKRDCFNRVRFKPVTTRALRLEVQLQPEFSGGILEWRVGK